MTVKPCTQCKRSLCCDSGDGDDFIVLRPCKCIVCPKCAFLMVVNRKFTTPSCTIHCQDVGSVFYLKSSRKDEGEVEIIDVKQHAPTAEKDPCRYYESLFATDGLSTCDDSDHPQDKLILSLSYAHLFEKEKARCPASITVKLDRLCGPETDEDEMNLRKVFAFLHDPLITSHGEIWKRVDIPRMTPVEFCNFMVHEDESLLLKLLYALATGEMMVPLRKITSDTKSFSRFLACCVAKEMIQRLESDRPGPFQLMIADALFLSGAPKELKDFLSKIRVAAHRTTVTRACSVNAIEKANDKIKLDPLEAFTLHFDNIGFKGRKKKWSQHTVMQICKISYQKLKEAGFYNNNALSRTRTTFAEFAGDALITATGEIEEEEAKAMAKKVVGIQKTDWQLLTRRVLVSIDTAIKLQLPDKQACQELVQIGEDCCETLVPLNLGVHIKAPTKSTRKATKPVAAVPLNNKIPGAALDSASEEDILRWRKSSGYATFYEANDMELDNVLHEDPNAKETVGQIANYLEQAAQYPVDYDTQRSNGELPVRDMFAAATCDGAPLKRWLDLKAEDLLDNKDEGEHEFDKATMVLGGFHFHMEFITMRGRLSRDVFSFFARLWRPTLPQLNWILSISDPKEYLLEMPQYILAHYRSAYDMLIQKNGDGPLSPITAVDVHRHMLHRAVEFPVCMAVLLDLRLVEISFMIRDSEKAGNCGDIELFLTTMRFAMALFTVTHATNYAHIVCDFLEWWQLSSDADKVFFKNWLFTKVSPFGKPVWVDRGVEWTIRHIRMFLGKKATIKQEQRMEQVVPDIPFRIKSKSDLCALLGMNVNDGWTSTDWNKQVARLSKVYFSTVNLIHETNLWGDGDLDGPFRCDDRSSFSSIDENGEQLTMSRSYLSSFSLGQERAIAYYAEHHVLNRGTVKRSKASVSLKLLPTATATRDKDFQKLKAIRLSVEPKEIEPLKADFPKKLIEEELVQLRECLYPDIPDELPATRKELVKMLCKYRKQYFYDFPQVYEDTVASVDDLDAADTATTEDSR